MALGERYLATLRGGRGIILSRALVRSLYERGAALEDFFMGSIVTRMNVPGGRGGREGAKLSSPTPSTRDRILGVRGGPGAPPGNVRRRHRNANAY